MFVCLSVGVKKNQTATLLCHYRGNLVKNFRQFFNVRLSRIVFGEVVSSVMAYILFCYVKLPQNFHSSKHGCNIL